MDKQTLKDQAVRVVDGMSGQLKDMSLFLHRNPELGGSEYQAAEYLQASARRRGFTVKANISGYKTAFISHKGTAGPKIAFLAEYDALPEIGHACGHNLIAAMSWGAAAAFAEAAGDLAVSYFIGCPAEETTGAKISMAKDGIFNNLTAAMIIHPSDGNYLGGTTYASHPIRITFHGRPAHVASRTCKGINALDALVMFYQGLKPLRQTFTQETVLAGIITKGGIAANIVPEEAVGEFSIRALTADYLENTVLPAVTRLAEGVALATNTTFTIDEYWLSYKELLSDSNLMELFAKNMALLGENIQYRPSHHTNGSTDVGNVSHVVPTIHPDICIGSGFTAHTSEFAVAAGSDYAQERLLVGAKAMAMTAIDLL